MIYKVRANELDSEPYYVEAGDQSKALEIAINEWIKEHKTQYDKRRPFLVEWVADKLLR